MINLCKLIISINLGRQWTHPRALSTHHPSLNVVLARKWRDILTKQEASIRPDPGERNTRRIAQATIMCHPRHDADHQEMHELCPRRRQCCQLQAGRRWLCYLVTVISRPCPWDPSFLTALFTGPYSRPQISGLRTMVCPLPLLRLRRQAHLIQVYIRPTASH